MNEGGFLAGAYGQALEEAFLYVIVFASCQKPVPWGLIELCQIGILRHSSPLTCGPHMDLQAPSILDLNCPFALDFLPLGFICLMIYLALVPGSSSPSSRAAILMEIWSCSAVFRDRTDAVVFSVSGFGWHGDEYLSVPFFGLIYSRKFILCEFILRRIWTVRSLKWGMSSLMASLDRMSIPLTRRHGGGCLFWRGWAAVPCGA